MIRSHSCHPSGVCLYRTDDRVTWERCHPFGLSCDLTDYSCLLTLDCRVGNLQPFCWWLKIQNITEYDLILQLSFHQLPNTPLTDFRLDIGDRAADDMMEAGKGATGT